MSKYHKLTKCVSLSEIEKIDLDDGYGKEMIRKTSKESTIRARVNKKAYRGRFSLGKPVGTTASRTQRRKSFNKGSGYFEDYDGDDDSPNSTVYNLSPSPSQPAFRCIPVIERETSATSTSTEGRKSTDSYQHMTLFVIDDNSRVERNSFYESMSSFMNYSKTKHSRMLILKEKEFQGRLEKMFTCNVKGQKPIDHRMDDVVWLMLKAFFAGRDVGESPDAVLEEDSFLYKRREQHWSIIDDMMNYVALPFPSTSMNLDPSYMAHMAQTRDEVISLLHRIDHYQSLFPTQKAMFNYVEKKQDHRLAEKLKERIDVLNAWLNTVEDLFERLRILGTLFEVDHLPDATRIWPRPMGHSQVPVSLKEARPVFKEYVGKNRNLKAMKKVLVRVWEICETSLVKAALLLSRPPSTYAEAASGYKPQIPISEIQSQRYNSSETSSFNRGCSNEQFKQMELPSFIPIFLFILGVRLELILEWLSFRSSFVTPFDENVDALTLGAIIEDSKDCLEEAIRIKLHYLATMQGIACRSKISEEFDNCLKDVFKKYLDYVSKWCTSIAEEGDVSRLFDGLTSKWIEASVYARSIRSGIEDLTAVYSSQIPRLIEKLVLEFWEESADRIMEEHSTADMQLQDEYERDDDRLHAATNSVFTACREHHLIIREVKDRIKRVFTLLRDRMLRDLNDCAGFTLNGMGEEAAAERLQETHLLVRLIGHDEKCELPTMCVDIKEKEMACKLVRSLCESRSISGAGQMIVLPYTSIRNNWNGNKVDVNLNYEAVGGLKHLRKDMILVSGDYSKRPSLSPLEKTVAATSSNDFVADHLQQLTESLVDHSKRLWDLVQNMFDVYEHDTQCQRYKNNILYTLQQAFDLVFDVYRDLLRMIGDSHKSLLSREMMERSVEIISRWNELVKAMDLPNKTPYIPVWANSAFNFIFFIVDPKWTSYLEEEQFEILTEKVEECRMMIVAQEDGQDGTIGRLTKRQSSFIAKAKKKVLGKDGRRVQLQEAAQVADDTLASRIRRVYPMGKVIEMAHHRFDLAAHMDQSRKPPFKWQLINQIGSGTFAVVYKALNLDDKCVIAVKKLRVIQKALPVIEREIDIFRGLNHDNLVKYYGCQVMKDDIYILMEFCAEGTLERICREMMDMTLVRMYTNSVLQAIAYLHRQPVVHRDIKPANIFLDLRSRLKLGDFGCSIRLGEEATVLGELAEYAGTPQYMAPEVQTYGGKMENGQFRGYGRAVDIWSLGCVVLHMVTGRVPWPDCHSYQITMRVCGNREKPPYPPQAPALLVNFLNSCFEFEPQNRKTAEALLQDYFANIYVDVDTVYASGLSSPLVPSDVLS